MYDYIEGELVERRATRVVLQAGGVGYDIAVPLCADFPARAGRTRVWTHFVVREDAQLLFGFPDARQREIFRLLLHVRGVGPAVALALLSSMPGDELLSAIARQEPAPLLGVKGIGKKTAEQILLDLRDKAPRLLEGRDTLVPRAPAVPRAHEDAVRALVSIGYSEKEARKSVELAATKVQTDELEPLVRAALKE